MVDVSGLLPVVGGAFVDWLKLFAAPLKNLDMLWIIIPIWGVWIFSEFFQEKKGTSFGNAVTNGATLLFVGVDWVRYVVRQISAGSLSFGVESASKLAVAAAIIFFGLLIIILGIKARSFVRLLGRVRETTYIMLVFSPMVYGVVDFSLRNFAVVLAFFPLFYAVVEVLDRVLPTPQMFKREEEEKLGEEMGMGAGKDVGFAGLGSDFGQDVFNQFPQPPQQPVQQQRGRMF